MKVTNGCLSIPEMSGSTKRYAWIDVEYFTKNENLCYPLSGQSRGGDFTGVLSSTNLIIYKELYLSTGFMNEIEYRNKCFNVIVILLKPYIEGLNTKRRTKNISGNT